MKTELPLTAVGIYQAQERLRGVAAATPVLSSPALDAAAGRTVVCKAEALQRTGSFKFRGAYNAVAALGETSRQRGVVGASSGNHAQALALAGRLLAYRAVVPSADDPSVMAGAGTVALELLRQAPSLALILVPVGGGGLAAGTVVAAKSINRAITVIGVEPRTGGDTAASLRAGHLITLPAVPDTIADCGTPARPCCPGRSTRCSSMT